MELLTGWRRPDQCRGPVGGACSATIARLIRIHTSCPPEPVEGTIAAVEHQIGTPGGFDLGVGAVLLDQQVRGPPDIEVGDAG